LFYYADVTYSANKSLFNLYAALFFQIKKL